MFGDAGSIWMFDIRLAKLNGGSNILPFSSAAPLDSILKLLLGNISRVSLLSGLTLGWTTEGRNLFASPSSGFFSPLLVQHQGYYTIIKSLKWVQENIWKVSGRIEPWTRRRLEMELTLNNKAIRANAYGLPLPVVDHVRVRKTGIKQAWLTLY